MYLDLSNRANFRLNRINEIKDYFIAGINEWELMSKGLSKYFASFDYFDKSLIFLSVTNDGVSIASFANIIGAQIGGGEHNKIVMLTRSKLNSIEKATSKALKDN